MNLFVLGEGYHNYHHVFPQDYRTSEFPMSFSLTTGFIDFFASLGWAYDLKTVSKQLIEKRSLRTGDGSRDGESRKMSLIVRIASEKNLL